MNSSFVPLVKSTETLKEKIENISQIAMTKGNTNLLSKIGVVKGLYSAYELAPSVQLIEAIAKALAEIIEDLLTLQISVKPFIGSVNRSNEKDIYLLFRDYLLENGFSKPDGTPTTTVDVYVRAVKRIFKNEDKSICNEMASLIDSLRQAILMPNVDIFNENRLNRAADLLSTIIEIKENSEEEIEKNKRDHGTTLSALKRFYMFIIWLISQCAQVQ